MTTTHYIAETDERNEIAAIWVTSKDRQSPKVFDVTKDKFDRKGPAKFSGASEAEITRWLIARSKAFSG